MSPLEKVDHSSGESQRKKEKRLRPRVGSVDRMIITRWLPGRCVERYGRSTLPQGRQEGDVWPRPQTPSRTMTSSSSAGVPSGSRSRAHSVRIHRFSCRTQLTRRISFVRCGEDHAQDLAARGRRSGQARTVEDAAGSVQQPDQLGHKREHCLSQACVSLAVHTATRLTFHRHRRLGSCRSGEDEPARTNAGLGRPVVGAHHF